MSNDRFERDRLVAAAVERAGADDFGEPTWQEGLDVLLGDLRSDARLHELGVEVAAADIVNNLANRLGIIAWRRDHPEIADGSVDHPISDVKQDEK